MAVFVLMCRDRENGFDLRARTRAAHLAYIAEAGVGLLLAGPLLDGQERPIGSMLIIDAKNESAARTFAENDPYAKAGLFADVAIRPIRLAAGTLMPE